MCSPSSTPTIPIFYWLVLSYGLCMNFMMKDCEMALESPGSRSHTQAVIRTSWQCTNHPLIWLVFHSYFCFFALWIALKHYLINIIVPTLKKSLFPLVCNLLSTLETGSLSELGCSLAVTKFQGTPCFCPSPKTGVIGALPYFVGPEDLGVGPHSCTVSTFIHLRHLLSPNDFFR